MKADDARAADKLDLAFRWEWDRTKKRWAKCRLFDRGPPNRLFGGTCVWFRWQLLRGLWVHYADLSAVAGPEWSDGPLRAESTLMNAQTMWVYLLKDGIAMQSTMAAKLGRYLDGRTRQLRGANDPV